MGATLKLVDETVYGVPLGGFDLELRLVSERMSVRELLKRRVRAEVERYNATEPDVFNGLVAPTQAEEVQNGYRLKTRHKLDWEAQLVEACRAFEGNDFLLLVDDAQLELLDEEVVLTPNSDVRFVKLVALVGG